MASQNLSKRVPFVVLDANTIFGQESQKGRVNSKPKRSMCDDYTPCSCLRPLRKRKKPLTLLLLDCWQREYDVRPYRNFKFRRIDFEERMERRFITIEDFPTIVRFLHKRSLCGAYLSGICVPASQHELLQAFADSLISFRYITLKLMNLPARFFETVQMNAAHMRVTDLSFEGTPLTTNDVNELRSFLIESKTLRYLNVASCSIDQYNFALLADGIHKSSSMRGFNCSRLLGNKLTLDTTKVAHTVSSLIWQNKLHEIEMQHCEFLAHDMDTIGEYLANKCSKLWKLNLANNIMAADGAEHLFRAIAHSGTLIRLNISRNELGSHGGEVVAKFLSSCFHLEFLDITYNGIGHEAINAILTTMKKSVRLLQLKLYGNRYNSKSAKILRRLLDAGVVPQDTIDVTVTFDEALSDYRVIPYY